MENSAKCHLCNCSDDFNTKTYLNHIDKKHGNMSRENQKKAIKKMSDRIRINRKKENINESVKNYLDPILSIVKQYLKKETIRQLYSEKSADNANYRLVNYLPAEAKNILKNHELNIDRNNHNDKKITETSKYSTFPIFITSRM